jgi:hypothetical protein
MERNSNHGSGRRGGNKPKRFEAKSSRTVQDGLLMLREDGANIMEWLNAMSTFLQEKFGSLGEFVETDSYPIRSSITMEELMSRFPDFESKDLRKLYMDAAAELLKQERKDKEEKHEIFSILQQAVTTEGWNRVKARTGFEAARGARDPNALLKLIKTEHSLKMNNVSDGEARYIAETRYNRIRQVAGMSLAEYSDAFHMAVKNMETLNCDEKPSESRQARHFLMKLDRDRYEDYMRDTINLDRNGTKDFPTTIQQVMDEARMHLPTTKNKGNRDLGTPMVYVGLSDEQLKKPCANCKQLGHWARECPEEDRRKLIQEDNNDAASEENDVKEDKARSGSKKKGNGGYKKKQAFRTRADSYDDFDDIFGFHVNSKNKKSGAISEQDPRLVCIDSFANMSFVSNSALLRNLRGKPLEVNGFHGKGTAETVGTFPGFGEAVHAPEAGANGLALCEIEERYKVTYVQRVHYLASRH